MMLCVYPDEADLNRGTIIREDTRTKKVQILTYDQYTHPWFKEIQNVFIPLYASPGMIVNRIISAKPAGKKLTYLKLVAHGEAGWLFLSGAPDPPIPPALPLAHDNVDEFARLRSHFDPLRGVIQLHGCGVASDTRIVVGGTYGHPITIPGTWRGSGEGLTYKAALAQAESGGYTKLGYLLMSRLAQVTGIPVEAPLHKQPGW